MSDKPTVESLEERAGVVTRVDEVLSIEETEGLWGVRGKQVNMFAVAADEMPMAFVETRAKQRAIRTVGIMDVALHSVTSLFKIDQDIEKLVDIKAAEVVDDNYKPPISIPDSFEKRFDFDQLDIVYIEAIVKV